VEKRVRGRRKRRPHAEEEGDALRKNLPPYSEGPQSEAVGRAGERPNDLQKTERGQMSGPTAELGRQQQKGGAGDGSSFALIL